ncbi:ATP-dependent DNA helicase [Maudiozyma humilis]|uniref:DNA helicase n=1 Tax=Maudiozyma humilis TaxID=51915 RepID=A0AAV5RVH8_MAUHU|nr:ATP-dependent DNA helicase [Kazachstania humilis]
MSAEGTSLIIDVSAEMLASGHFSALLPYIEHTLLNKLDRARKTDYINIYLANHAETKNVLEVSHVYELLEMSAPLSSDTVISVMQQLYALTPGDVVSRGHDDDPHDDIAVVEQCVLLAMLGIQRQFGKRKMLRQIVCFTDDMHSLNMTPAELLQAMEEYAGRFVLVDCRDDTESAEATQAYAQSGWHTAVSFPDTDSRAESLAAMLARVAQPQPPTVRPTRLFAGQLRVGATAGAIEDDALADNSCLCMRVEAYPATKAVHGLQRRQVLRDAAGGVTLRGGKPVCPKSAVEYDVRKPREDNPDGFDEVPVPASAVTKAYRFGGDYVILPAPLAEELGPRGSGTRAGLDVRGFVRESTLPRHYLCGESAFVLADTRQGSLGDAGAFAALVDALLSRGACAVARYVARDGAEAQMCALVPVRVSAGTLRLPASDWHSPGAKGVPALSLCRLPFAEDERVYTGGGSASPNTISKFEEDTLMSQFVDSMDMDGRKDTPRGEYFPHYDAGDNASTLPLPPKNDPSHRGDPLVPLAIAPHRQKQVLYAYIDQVLIRGEKQFTPPELPDSIRQEIEPAGSAERTAGIAQQLVQQLGLREVPRLSPRKVKDDTPRDDAAVEAPPLDELLALGRRGK